MNEKERAEQDAAARPLKVCVNQKRGHLVGIPPKLRELRDPIFDVVPRACHVAVEIGSLQGWFSWRMAKFLPDASIFCIDPFGDDPENGYDGEYNLSCWKKNTRDFFGKTIFLKRGDSVSEAAKWGDGVKVDFLFIDGDHSYEAVLADLRSWWPKVRPGGLIAGHDTTGPHSEAVMKALEVFGAERRIPEIQLQDVYSFTGTRLTECFWFYKDEDPDGGDGG